jgi:hypothetical protein
LNSQLISPDIHHAIEEGINCILGHFPEKEPIWPRTISTKTTEGRQVLVYDKEEALARFKQANYRDCKICAYPFYVEWKGINRQAPNLIFIDEDELNFKSREALDKGLAKTLKNISEKFGIAVNPTILWSGHGCHIYLPVEAFVLEQESEFARFEQPSRRFIQFAEQFLSNKKSDPCHSFTMSFKNCMLRVPWSFNAKSEPSIEVKITQRWNGVRPSIKPLLFDFYIYLQDLKVKKIQQKHHHPQKEFCMYRSRNNG